MKDELLTIDEVGVLIGRSQHTINYWYVWKKENPDHELAQLLPDYVQLGNRQTRYWKRADIWRLLEFKMKVPQGRSGIMKKSIQKYFHGGQHAGVKEQIGITNSTVCAE